MPGVCEGCGFYTDVTRIKIPDAKWKNKTSVNLCEICIELIKAKDEITFMDYLRLGRMSKKGFKRKPRPRPIRDVSRKKVVKKKVTKKPTPVPVETIDPIEEYKFIEYAGTDVYHPSELVAIKGLEIPNQVVMVTYNQKIELHKTLTALQTQDLITDIIVVDDGSTDGTTKMVLKEFPNVRLIQHGTHYGFKLAKVTGMRAVERARSCANVILVSAGEIADKNFLRAIIDRKLGKRSVCFYSSAVHANNLRTLFDVISTKFDAFWNPSIQGPKKVLPKADVYITCSSEHRAFNVFDLPRTLFMFHGLSPAELECISAHKTQRYKGILLSGQWYLDKIKEGVWNINTDNFIDDFFHVVGWPKGDILFKPGIDKLVETVKGNLKLPYEKTILYAPTGFWRMGYSSFCGTINPLIDIANKLEMNLIVKLHFATSVPHKPSGVISKQAKQRVKDMPNITWIESNELNDITPLYKVADTLVSDASSTLFEFLQVDKMSIEMMNRGYEYNPKIYVYGKRNISINDKLEDWHGYSMPTGSTIKCWDIDKLSETISSSIYHPERTAKRVEEWKQKLFYKLDGKASYRVLEIVENILR